MLDEKERDLQRHRIFSTFLESVVQDKSGDKEGFTGIEDLQDRFTSLKNENKTLMTRVSKTFSNLFITLFYRNKPSTRKWKRLEPGRRTSSMN